MPSIAFAKALLLTSQMVAAPAGGTQAVPVFSAELSLVNVAVTVEDRNGQPIPGLTSRDFALSEDGKQLKLELCARMGEPGGGPSTALDLGLLVDTSDSMLETLRRSQEATVRFLTALPGARELLVVLFDQRQRLERFDRDHPEAFFDRLKSVSDGGNTALRDAIGATLRAMHSSSGRSALVLLTDGIDTVSATSVESLDRAVQANSVVIYPVAFPPPPGTPGAEEAMRSLGRLAELSGGRLFRLEGEHSLQGVLDEILADLRAQYVLGFAPTTSGSPDRLRRITVKVSGHKGAAVRHRAGYRLKR
jgi:Ca-activated chloride channel family protein